MPDCSSLRERVLWPLNMDVLAVLDGYSLDKVLPCIANPEKIRVIVKIGRGYRPLLTTEYEQEKKRIVEALAE